MVRRHVRMLDEPRRQSSQLNHHQAKRNARLVVVPDPLRLFLQRHGVEPSVAPPMIREQFERIAGGRIQPAFDQVFRRASAGDRPAIQGAYRRPHDNVGRRVFREHPKGSGLICAEHATRRQNQSRLLFPHLLIRLCSARSRFDMLKRVEFQPEQYKPEIARVLALAGGGMRLMPLVREECISTEGLEAVKSLDVPESVRAGLYLYLSCWDEAHATADAEENPN